MKKIIFILSLIVASVCVNAQSRTLKVSGTNSIDTVTDGGNKTWYTSVSTLFTNYSIQLNVTKISGTVGGTLKLVYSTDGTNFYNFNDTVYTAANASGVYGWNVHNVAATYIGVKFTGTGTMSASAAGTVTGKRNY
jgi:hypothetical protein